MCRLIVSLVCCFLTGTTIAHAQPSPQRWESAIAKFEKEDEHSGFARGGIVFTGSSSIARWKDLGSYFPDHKVLNRGFGGSMLVEVNAFLDRIVIKHQPRTVVLFCGGNDLAANRTPKQVVADFQTFHQTIHKKLPETRIVYLSIHLPPGRVNQAAKIHEVNALIAAECKSDPRFTFVNIHDLMLGPDGQPNLKLYADKLHPTTAAYELWAKRLQPALK